MMSIQMSGLWSTRLFCSQRITSGLNAAKNLVSSAICSLDPICLKVMAIPALSHNPSANVGRVSCSRCFS